MTYQNHLNNLYNEMMEEIHMAEELDNHIESLAEHLREGGSIRHRSENLYHHYADFKEYCVLWMDLDEAKKLLADCFLSEEGEREVAFMEICLDEVITQSICFIRDLTHPEQWEIWV